MTRLAKVILGGIAWGLTLTAGSAPAPLGTAFDYRGRLDEGGAAANGTYDFVFTLYDAESGGNALGTVNTRPAVPVSDGVFVVRLDFGNQQYTFNGQACWLEIQVRSAGGSGYTTLAPRQAVPLAPYSLYALYAGGLADVDEVGVNEYLRVGEDTNPTAKFDVFGQSMMTGAVQMQNNLTVNGEVRGDTLNIGNGMTVSGISVFGGLLESMNGLNVSNTFHAYGAADLSSTLFVAGSATFKDDVSVDGKLYANGGISTGAFQADTAEFDTLDVRALSAQDGIFSDSLSAASGDFNFAHVSQMTNDVINATDGHFANVTIQNPMGSITVTDGHFTNLWVNALYADGGTSTLQTLIVSNNVSFCASLTVANTIHTGPIECSELNAANVVAHEISTDVLYVTGTKSFVQPHPADPTKVIVFTCLEGPEAGTYVRGTAELVNGEATVALPEAFGLVTGADGVTAQVTPRGSWLQLYVVSVDAHTLTVREAGGRSGNFDYLVQGVRQGYEQLPVIRDRAPAGGTP